MKILLNSRIDLNSKPGGDTLQINKTAEQLRKLGVSVNISTELQPDLSKYDLVHLFNITRPHETYVQFLNAQNQNKPVAITPLYQNFDEWDRNGRVGLQSLFMKVIPDKNTKELFKLFTRALTNIHLYPQFFAQLNNGYVQQQQKILSGVNALLLNSDLEMKLLEKDLGIHNKYYIVPNGIDAEFANTNSNLFMQKYGIQDFVLCVANFSSIKNQIKLMQALKNTGIKLVLIGKPQKNHKKYFQIIKKDADKNANILLITDASKDMIKSAYTSAKVHVLPSWFETCGLVSLEAGLAGCNVVSTDQGYAREYLADFAKYCSPADINSIKNSVIDAYRSPKSDLLKNHLLNNFSWERTAQKTLEVYRDIINATGK
ncbi:MAG: glycosyltransferase [Patescibacteria group bacterium]|jgi:glycosyltransferase involved in cell wall biosynthesis